MWNGFLCGCGGLKLIYVRRISTANVLFTLQLNINFVSWYCNYFLLTAVHSSNQLATRIEWQNTCPIMFLHATTRCGRLHSVHCTDWWKTASPSRTLRNTKALLLLPAALVRESIDSIDSYRFYGAPWQHSRRHPRPRLACCSRRYCWLIACICTLHTLTTLFTPCHSAHTRHN